MAACGNLATVEQNEEKEIDASRFSLLQVPSFETASRRKGFPLEAFDTPSTDYLRKALPLAWTHVPKCGTSFLNTIIRLPGVCPGLPDIKGLYVPAEIDNFAAYFSMRFPDWPDLCPGLLQPPGKTIIGAHTNVGSQFEEFYDGHGLIMLRHPQQRLISAYKYLMAEEEDTYNIRNMTAADFAKATAGCAVRMLTKDGVPGGTGWGDCMGVDADNNFIPALEVHEPDVIEAQRRLRGYAFVGITDDWSLSICLLHEMFGGDCHPTEFENLRTQRSSSAEGYDTSVLEGFVDRFDVALFKEAVSIFNENLERYGVSEKSCQKCFQAADLSSTS